MEIPMRPDRPGSISSTGHQSGTLLEALRVATRVAHHRIDHHERLAPLVRADLQRTHYISVLQAFDWIYRVLDPAFAAAMERFCPTSGFQPSNRSGWLAEDLALLMPDAARRTPWMVPVIDGIAELVGRLYVIEGSTLGGQVIARQLQLSLGVGPASGGRFFHGHGPATVERWRAFTAFAEQVCPPADAQAACAAANRMFTELEKLLDQWFAMGRSRAKG